MNPQHKHQTNGVSPRKRDVTLFRLLDIETRLFLRQPFISAALSVFAILSMAAAMNGLAIMARQRAAISQVNQAEARKFAEAQSLAQLLDSHAAVSGPFRDPRKVSNFVRLVLAVPAIKTAMPAAVLDPGQADLLPFYFVLNTGPSSKTTTTYEYVNPQSLLLGKLDLNLILLYLLPLFLALLGFQVATLETHTGIAPIFELTSKRPTAVYARRLLVAATPLDTIYLFTSWGAMILDARHNGWHFSRVFASGATVGALTLLYTTFWLAVILFVVRRSRTPAAALTRFSLVWTAVCVLIPCLANRTSVFFYPTMSRLDYIDRFRKANDAEVGKMQTSLVRYLLLHPELRASAGKAPLPAGAVALIAAEAADSVTEKLDLQIQGPRVKQQKLVSMFQVLSPTLLAEQELDRIAGEDSDSQERYLKRTHRQIAALRAFYRPLLFADAVSDSSRFRELFGYPRLSVDNTATHWMEQDEAFTWLAIMAIIVWISLAWRTSWSS